jgi:dTDP-glucose 4,6-dehydratase
MKRVLLTGSGGFVGAHTLAHLLANTKWEIVVTDSFRHKGKTDRLSEVLDDYPRDSYRVKVVTHDLTVPITPQMAKKFGKLDYIISMASESHVDRSIVEPRSFIENNVNLILTLLEYIREYPVEKFLHVSTDEVYGNAAPGFAHPEGDPHLPSNPYSASKAAQEDICHSYWRTYNLPIVVTNTMNIIGERQDPEKFVPLVIKKVLAGEQVLIHGSAEGEPGTRFYLHARNQADALVYILKNLPVPKYTDGQEMARFNVLGEREVDNLALALLVAKFVGKTLKFKMTDFHSSRPGHDLRYALDGKKLRDAGWIPPVPFEDSLQKTVEWTLAHEEWLI